MLGKYGLRTADVAESREFGEQACWKVGNRRACVTESMARLQLGVQNPKGPGSKKRPVRAGSKSKQFLIESFIQIEHFWSLASPAPIRTFPACLVSMNFVQPTLQKVWNSASRRAGK